jgi:EthD domain
MITEMVFENKDAWKAAMKTPEMMESGKDAMKFAGELVSVHFAEEYVTKI